MSAFHEREYSTWLVVGEGADEPLFNWSTWSALVPYFDPLMEAVGMPCGVHSYQVNMASRKQVRFGTLAWTSRSHARWTHRSPETGADSDGWFFGLSQFCAPTLPQSVKRNRAPDLYMNLQPSHPLQRGAPWKQALFVAAAVDSPLAQMSAEIDAATRAAGELMGRAVICRSTLPWGKNPSGDGYTLVIEMCLNDLLHYNGGAAGILDGSYLPNGWNRLCEVRGT